MALTSAQAASLLGNTVTTTNTYDDNISGLVNSILNAAQGEANAPYTPYTGQRVAGLTQDELNSDQSVRDNYLSTQPLYSQGTNLINQGTTGLNNLMTNQGTWNQNSANQYMSPYISNVINSTSEEALRNNQMAMNQIRGNSAMSGAFGGSGDILAQTEGWNNNQRNLNSTVADLYNTGYNNAQTQFNADRDFGLKGVTQYNTQSEALQKLGANQQAALYKDTSALKNVGSNTRDIAQTNLNTAYSDWENQKDYNKNQLNWLQNLLTGAAGSNQATGTTTVTTPASTPGTSNFASSLLQGAGYASNIADSDIGNWIANLFSTGGHVEAYAEGGTVGGATELGADLIKSLPMSDLITLLYGFKAPEKLHKNSRPEDIVKISRELARRQELAGLMPTLGTTPKGGPGTREYMTNLKGVIGLNQPTQEALLREYLDSIGLSHVEYYDELFKHAILPTSYEENNYAEGGAIEEADPWTADLNYGLSQVNQYKPDITNPQYVGAMSVSDLLNSIRETQAVLSKENKDLGLVGRVFHPGGRDVNKLMYYSDGLQMLTNELSARRESMGLQPSADVPQMASAPQQAQSLGGTTVEDSSSLGSLIESLLGEEPQQAGTPADASQALQQMQAIGQTPQQSQPQGESVGAYFTNNPNTLMDQLFKPNQALLMGLEMKAAGYRPNDPEWWSAVAQLEALKGGEDIRNNRMASDTARGSALSNATAQARASRQNETSQALEARKQALEEAKFGETSKRNTILNAKDSIDLQLAAQKARNIDMYGDAEPGTGTALVSQLKDLYSQKAELLKAAGGDPSSIAGDLETINNRIHEIKITIDQQSKTVNSSNRPPAEH